MGFNRSSSGSGDFIRDIQDILSDGVDCGICGRHFKYREYGRDGNVILAMAALRGEYVCPKCHQVFGQSDPSSTMRLSDLVESSIDSSVSKDLRGWVLEGGSEPYNSVEHFTSPSTN